MLLVVINALILISIPTQRSLVAVAFVLTFSGVTNFILASAMSMEGFLVAAV